MTYQNTVSGTHRGFPLRGAGLEVGRGEGQEVRGVRGGRRGRHGNCKPISFPLH